MNGTILEKPFRIVVDYNHSPEQLLVVGDDRAHKLWRFPIDRDNVGELEACRFYYYHPTSIADAVKEIETVDAKNPWLVTDIEFEPSYPPRYFFLAVRKIA
jgi:hypothetical protein